MYTFHINDRCPNILQLLVLLDMLDLLDVLGSLDMLVLHKALH